MTTLQKDSFSGIWPALLTPLDAQQGVDVQALAAHAQRLLGLGSAGVTLFGTTGEGSSFSVAERMAVLEGLIAQGIAAERIIVGTSCTPVPETVALTRHATQLGVHASLILPPFYFKGVSDQGVIDAYRQIMDQSMMPGLAVYVYHIPQVTGVRLSAHVIRTLYQAYPEQILGIKDSEGNLDHSLGLAQNFMKDLTVYVGFEPNLPALGRLGSKGAISGLANFVPKLVHRLVTRPDGPQAARDLERVKEILTVLDGLSLMPALKGIMATLDDRDQWLAVRPPLVALTQAEQSLLQTRLKALALDQHID